MRVDWEKQRAVCVCGHQFQEHWNDKRQGFECSRCQCQRFDSAIRASAKETP